MLTADITTIPRPDTPMTVVSPLGIVEGTEVTIPWLDARTAKVPDLSMYDPRIAPLIDWDNWRDKTLQLALRVRYVAADVGKQIAFWGPIHAPIFDYETEQVTIQARDPSLRLERGFVVSGDDLISPGATIDGRGAATIVNAGQNRPNQDDLNWPSLGINIGVDLSTPNHTEFRTSSRGDQLWQTLQEHGQLQIGPDWELEPFETSPTNTATGAVTDAADHAIPDNATTDFALVSGLPGLIEGFRVGVYITHDKPSELDLWLVHPDNTVIQLYDGTRDKNRSVTGGDAFGTDDSDLCFFQDFGHWLYGTILNASEWPKTGAVRSDEPLLSTLADKDAAGTWKLRIRDRSAGNTGTLKAWSLRFQLPSPAYVRLNTWDKPPENPAMDAKFHDGEGPNNANIRISPLGDQVRNWARFGRGGGNGSSHDEVIRQNSASRDAIGTYQDWVTTDQNDSTAVLAALANRDILAYSNAPPSLVIKPDDDRGQADLPRLLFNYKVGGHVLGVAKKGFARHRVPARVTNGVLRNSGGVVQTDLNVIPVVAIGSDVSDG